jgi:hypothetical protein
MNYAMKKEIADTYLEWAYGTSWDELADTNSLHDAETKEDIIDLCEDRANSDMIE